MCVQWVGIPYKTREFFDIPLRKHPEDAYIERLILENLPSAMRSRKLRLTGTRIAHIIQADGCELSDRQILRRVAIVRKRLNASPRKEVFLDLDAPRGSWQVDFGQFEAIVNGQNLTLHTLLLSSAYSNAFTCHACIGEDTACLFEGLEACFQSLGGVPPVLRFDNFAPAVWWKGHDRMMTDAFSRFMVHHGFRAEFCNPRSGWEKGNVERKVKYLRDNFFLPVPSFESWERLNASLEAFASNDRDRLHYKKHRKIDDLLRAEKPLFLDLKKPFGYIERRAVSVDKQGFVLYRGNRYFTRHDFTYPSAILEATAHTVCILGMDGAQVARHERAAGKDRKIQPAIELAQMLAKKPSAIPYTIQPLADAQALRECIQGLRAAERVDPIMQYLTRRQTVPELRTARDLARFDTLAGIADGKNGRNHTVMQQIEARLGHSGHAAALG